MNHADLKEKAAEAATRIINEHLKDHANPNITFTRMHYDGGDRSVTAYVNDEYAWSLRLEPDDHSCRVDQNRQNFSTLRVTIPYAQDFMHGTRFSRYDPAFPGRFVHIPELNIIMQGLQHNLYSALASVFTHAFTHNMLKGLAPRESAQRVRGEYVENILWLSGRKREWVNAIHVLGRKPTHNEMELLNLMEPLVREMIDTRILIAPVIKHANADIMKRLQANTTRAAIKRAKQLTPKKALKIAMKHFDPRGELLPRHWRWLTRQHPRYGAVYRNAKYTMLAADHYPHDHWEASNKRLLTALASAAERFNLNLNHDLTRTLMEAIKRVHANPKKHRHEPYATPDGMQDTFVTLLRRQQEIVLDNDLRNASLARLYGIAQEFTPVEPPESLRFGCQEFSFPHEGPVTINEFTFTPLKSHALVYQEGHEMAHCLFGGWMNAMIAGNARAYRGIGSDGSRITVLLGKNGSQWRVMQATGRYNSYRPADRCLEAQEIVDRYYNGWRP